MEPRVFPLGIPDDFFADEARARPSRPDIQTCHMQGLAITDDTIVLSCLVFNREAPETRTYEGRAYLLKAALCDVTGCDDHSPRRPTWISQNITEPVPEEHNARITRMLVEKRHGRRELTPGEKAIQQLITHPSGISPDPLGRGVWIGNSCYDEDTFSYVYLVDPARIGAAPSVDALARYRRAIPRHFSAAVLVGGRYVFGPTFASRELALVDSTGEHEPAVVPNPTWNTPGHVEIQDCANWGVEYILCNGEYKYEVSPAAPDKPLPRAALTDVQRDTIRIRRGRIQVLRVDPSPFPDVRVEHVGFVKARLSAGAAASIDLGVRSYRKNRDGTERRVIPDNDYGGHETPLTLTYEGMALGPNHQYVYFVPEDLPDAVLIRLRVVAL